MAARQQEQPGRQARGLGTGGQNGGGRRGREGAVAPLAARDLPSKGGRGPAQQEPRGSQDSYQKNPSKIQSAGAFAGVGPERGTLSFSQSRVLIFW